MHSDEDAYARQTDRASNDAVAPAIAEHSGRIVKNTGDGSLAEFPSAVEAVCAANTRIHGLGNIVNYRCAANKSHDPGSPLSS
jgi:class 3 adenylate cyclase